MLILLFRQTVHSQKTFMENCTERKKVQIKTSLVASTSPAQTLRLTHLNRNHPAWMDGWSLMSYHPHPKGFMNNGTWLRCYGQLEYIMDIWQKHSHINRLSFIISQSFPKFNEHHKYRIKPRRFRFLYHFF